MGLVRPIEAIQPRNLVCCIGETLRLPDTATVEQTAFDGGEVELFEHEFIEVRYGSWSMPPEIFRKQLAVPSLFAQPMTVVCDGKRNG